MSEVELDRKERVVAHRDSARVKYLPTSSLIDGEDEQAYSALRTKIFDYVKPQDIFEEIFADDIVNLQWEVMRCRRLKAALMNSEKLVDARQITIHSGGCEIQQVFDGDEWREPNEAEILKQLLEYKGISTDALAATTFARILDQIERIDALGALAEERRSRALQELMQHRDRFAKIIQLAIKEVEDAEYTDITPANGDVGATEAA